MITNLNIWKNLISRVNQTLQYYEQDYTSALRAPHIDRERCHSFEQYIEIRFNFECWQIPELQGALLITEGKLFRCIQLEDVDLLKRKFSIAHVELNIPEELLLSEDETLKIELEKARSFFGGKKISFNNVKKKIKFSID